MDIFAVKAKERISTKNLKIVIFVTIISYYFKISFIILKNVQKYIFL